MTAVASQGGNRGFFVANPMANTTLDLMNLPSVPVVCGSSWPKKYSMPVELKVQAAEFLIHTFLSRQHKKAAVFRLSPLSASFDDYHDPRRAYCRDGPVHFLILD